MERQAREPKNYQKELRKWLELNEVNKNLQYTKDVLLNDLNMEPDLFTWLVAHVKDLKLRKVLMVKSLDKFNAF